MQAAVNKHVIEVGSSKVKDTESISTETPEFGNFIFCTNMIAKITVKSFVYKC